MRLNCCHACAKRGVFSAVSQVVDGDDSIVLTNVNVIITIIIIIIITALAEADENEVEAIANVFSSDKAVKIGCVKSNMGHSEPASGLCGLTKVIKTNTTQILVL